MCRLKRKISVLENDPSRTSKSQNSLSDIKKELLLAKLALADRDIKLFEITSAKLCPHT